MKNGLIKVAAAIPAVKVADTKFNLIETEKQIAVADGQGVEIIVFPELSLTGYSCQDLFQQQLLLDDAEQSVLRLLEFYTPVRYNSHCGCTRYCWSAAT